MESSKKSTYETIAFDYSSRLDSLRNFVNEVEKSFPAKQIAHQLGITFAILDLLGDLPEDLKIKELLKDHYQDAENLIFKEFNLSSSEVILLLQNKTATALTFRNKHRIAINRGGQVLTKHADSLAHLRATSLISLLSNVEWFLGTILRFHYRLHPKSLGSKEKIFSPGDLENFDSIESAISYAIDEKIDGFLRLPFEELLEILKRDLALSIRELGKFRETLIEIFQRRNLFVHNDGRVNDIYLKKFPWTYVMR